MRHNAKPHCTCDVCAKRKRAQRAAEKRYRDRNPDKRRALGKRWLERNPDKRRGIAARWRSNNPLYNREKKLRDRYGLTVDAFEALLVAQGGACAICRRRFVDGVKACVDHDHVSGRIRGVLCKGCNSALGYFDDSVLNLTGAIQYLLRSFR